MKHIIILFLSLLLFASCSIGNKKDFEKGVKIGKGMALKSQTNLDSLGVDGMEIKEWKFHFGDNATWANQHLVDSTWKEVSLNDISKLDQDVLSNLKKSRVLWLRKQFKKDTLPQPIILSVSQIGASEIYINGKKVKAFGKIDTNKIEGFNPCREPFVVQLDADSVQTLAVRLGYPDYAPSYEYVTLPTSPLICYVNAPKTTNIFQTPSPTTGSFFGFIMNVGIFIILSILHFSYYRNQPENKANLYFSLYAFTSFLSVSLYLFLRYYLNDTSYYPYLFPLYLILSSVFVTISLLLALYKTFDFAYDKTFWFLVIITLIYPFISFSHLSVLLQVFIHGLINFLTYIFIGIIVFRAIKRKKRGAVIFGTVFYSIIIVVAILIITFIIIIVYVVVTSYATHELQPKSSISLNEGSGKFFGKMLSTFFTNGKDALIAIGLSLYLSAEYGHLVRKLSGKVDEIQRLSDEKQQLLASQNEMLENQVNERTAALNQSLDELKATQAQLIQSEKLASLGELTAGIAHEIQNPLNFVTNFSELSVDLIQELQEERQLPADEQDAGLMEELLDDLTQNQEKINFHGKRASNIVKGMLEHSRARTGEKMETDLNQLLDEYLRLSFHGMRAKDKSFNADFQTELDENLPNVQVIPQDIGRVFLNLINNAFYAVNERAKTDKDFKPMVKVSTQAEENQIKISIEDNGTGIPDAVKQKIFQPFFTTKPTGEGTGLGLSLSYDIITKGHGGNLEVESQEGKGTTFTIILPIK